MDYFNKIIDYTLHHVLEPGLNWVLSHPFVSGIAVLALIYFSVRNYRML